jgi:Chaperone of endosialidase
MAPGNDEATRRLRDLRGVTWQWREEAPAEAKQQPGMGVIAQEVGKVFPQWCRPTSKGVSRSTTAA